MPQHPDRTGSEPGWALVTGASAGIGAEFCRQLAARGYRLVLTARREDKLRSLARELEQDHGVECRVIALDLSLPDAALDLCARLESEGVDIEVLVNNAGYGLAGHYTDPRWESHAHFIRLMVTAVCELTWRLVAPMQSRRKGYIINVSSLAGLVPGSAGHTLYAASKAFLIRFSESLAAENQHRGVRVSALCPGFTWSEFHDVAGTREIVNRMPSWMWMDADAVVAYGLESVFRNPPRVVAVPGRVNRTIGLLMRLVPSALARGFARRMSRHFRAQDAGP